MMQRHQTQKFHKQVTDDDEDESVQIGEDQEANYLDKRKKRTKSITIRPSYANFLSKQTKENKKLEMHSYVSLSSQGRTY